MARTYASKAGEDLRSYLETNLGTYVDAVETAESVTLATPGTYLAGVHPFDERFPRVEVEWQGGGPTDGGEGFRTDRWEFDFTVHLITAFADADVITGQEDQRRYATALIDCIEADVTLGGNVIAAEITDIASSGEASEHGNLVGVLSMSTTVYLHTV